MHRSQGHVPMVTEFIEARKIAEFASLPFPFRFLMRVLSEPEPVTQLNREFSGICEVGSAKRIAIVEHVAFVGEIQRRQAHVPVLADTFADRKIIRKMRR